MASNNKSRKQLGGYVYAMSNESMPGLIKVGFTTNDPRTRASELYTTGVPTPFIVEFAVLVDDPIWTEKAFHEMYDEYRVKGREFFELSLTDVITGLFRFTELCMEAVCETMAIDDGDHRRYTDQASVAPHELSSLLKLIEPNEWAELSNRLKANKNRKAGI